MGHGELGLAAVARLGDLELMAGLQGLVARDRALTARLLVHPGEVDARGLYRERAFPSMFEYCVEALRMSPDEAYVRLRAAKLGREFPVVLQMLGRNELHLSAIKLLAPHLTQANHLEVLARARGQSKRAVELIVAELAPQPDVPSVVRKLPSARPAVRAVLELPRSAAPQVTTPLSPGRYKVQFTATQALHDKLQRLKDLMRHSVPDGDLSAIIERAADLLLEQKMKQCFARTEKPRAASQVRKSSSRYVPRAVVREVCARDEERCTFVSPEGRRCAARGLLELQHEIPYARGGLPTPENMKILCRAHNVLLAERDFGRDFMQSRARRRTEGAAEESWPRNARDCCEHDP